MKRFTSALMLVLASSTCLAGAGDDSYNKGVDMLYRASCKNEFPSGSTAKDLEELNEAAQSIRIILKAPKETIKAILEASSRQDLGVFPLLMQCTLITSMGNRLSSEGCRDLDGSTIDGHEAVRLCADILQKIKDR